MGGAANENERRHDVVCMIEMRRLCLSEERIAHVLLGVRRRLARYDDCDNATVLICKLRVAIICTF